MLQTLKEIEPYGPESNGIMMTPREFDAADFEEDWRYQLINGVLIVTPTASNSEIDPNEELGYLLRNYRDQHPQGSVLDYTGFEQTIRTGKNRRRVDRGIWTGLGRRPRKNDIPTIAVEFVARRKRDRDRDTIAKRDEYLAAGVQEYWVMDRFAHTLTVYRRVRGKRVTRVYQQDQTYRTDLLPGFDLPLASLFVLADRWTDDELEVDA